MGPSRSRRHLTVVWRPRKTSRPYCRTSRRFDASTIRHKIRERFWRGARQRHSVGQTMQQELLTLYRHFVSSIAISDGLAWRLSSPLQVAVGSSWESAPRRVLVVGQETKGWGGKPGDNYAWPHPPLTKLGQCQCYDGSITALIDVYSAFEFSRHDRKLAGSPFWRAFHILLARVQQLVIPNFFGPICFGAT
jgi:hypothetical protein